MIYGTGTGVGVTALNDFPSDWNICTVRTRIGMEGIVVSAGASIGGFGRLSTTAIASSALSSPTADTFTCAWKGTSTEGNVGNNGPSATKRRRNVGAWVGVALAT